MSPESAKDFYNRQYGLHKDGRISCPNSLHDLEKAHRRVRGVFHAFRIPTPLHGASVLDVGCGLGYYTKALSCTGANVLGIDISQAGTECARSSFPECQFRCAAWPDNIEKEPKFDIIWTVGLSLINTLDVHMIHEKLIVEAQPRLKPGGSLILGWGTNFSGRTQGNWSHWSLEMLHRMRAQCGLSVPIVPVVRARWLSWLVIRTGSVIRKEVPIFMRRVSH